MLHGPVAAVSRTSSLEVVELREAKFWLRPSVIDAVRTEAEVAGLSRSQWVARALERQVEVERGWRRLEERRTGERL